MYNPNQFRPMSPQQRQIEYARHQGTALAEADYRRRKALRAAQAQRPTNCERCHVPMRVGSAYCTHCGAPVQPPRSAQRGTGTPSSWKKSVGIMILIAVGVLTLGAVLQAHSSPGTPTGTPGVINMGANIRTGPGTENSIAATAPAGTKIVISCRIATPAGKWDKLTSPYRGLFVSAILVHSHRPARC